MTEQQEAIIRQKALLLISRNYGKTYIENKIFKRLIKCLGNKFELQLKIQTVPD